MFRENCVLLAAFFASLPQWREAAPSCGIQSQLDQYTYDALLRGTDASYKVPLFASECKGVGRVLFNEVTRDVVAYYKKYGYIPVDMEKNPPDYLGQQLRFLAYLAAAGEMDAAQRFLTQFTVDTVMGCTQAIRGYTEKAEVLFICTALEDLMEGKTFQVKGQGPFDEFGKLLPPIALEEERTICSAGINNCGGKCRIDVDTVEGCILRTDTDRSGNDPQIRACVRGRGYRKTFLHSDRLRYPMKRVGKRGEGKFKRISWEEAASTIADEVARIGKTYGPGSRYVIYSTGVSAVMRPDDMIKRLLSLDGGYLGAYNSYSSACAGFVTPYIYGTAASGNSQADILNTKFLLLWGHNPSESIFGSYRNFYLAEAKRRGIRIVVIDPRFSDTAMGYADEWIGLRPSTDSALADAMAYVIWSKGLQDQEFMDTYCIGFDEAHMPAGVPAGESYHSYLFGKKDGVEKTPAWAEKITGVPAETIERLAVEYATAKPACLLPGLGLQRTGNGEQSTRSTAMLACLTGNVGIPGGGAAGAGWVNNHLQPCLPIPANPYPGKIPTFLWSKAITSGKEMQVVEDGLQGVDHLESDVKLIFNLAGNTLINQHSDINDTIRILEDTSKCECIICSDIFMTPSARFADILLPSTSVFEGNNIAPPWSGEDYLLHNTKAIEPLFDCRFEYEWIKEVARGLGLYEEFTQGHELADDWLRAIYDDLRQVEKELPDYDTFKAEGGYQYKKNRPVIAFEKNIQEGKPFHTPSGKIEIFSKTLYDMGNPEEIPGLPCYTPCPEGPEDPLRERFPLQLIGYHTKRRCHSIHDNNEWMEEIDPPAVWMHPADAAARDIVDGQLVEAFNDRGVVKIPAKVTERIVKGVVAISQGGWYTPNKDGVDVRGSINVLTQAKKPSPLAKGNPQHTNLVEVRPAKG